ncbi:MAG: type I-E CRISPR-associated protein Cas6/Cse3/CasE [Acidimicrobiales bacterium]
MFLTRCYIDARKGWRYLDSPQRLHAALYGAMPTQPVDVSSGRPLWRVDHRETTTPVLWIVSHEEPQLEPFAKEAGRSVDGVTYQTRSYDPLLDQLDQGQVYAFRLTANPTRSVVTDGRSRRFGHVTVAQQMKWLVDRAPRLGFTFPLVMGEPDVAVIGGGNLAFRRNENNVTLATSEFAGHLQVSDPVMLRATLTKGIGHARAYGCGLLTLAKTAPGLGVAA